MSHAPRTIFLTATEEGFGLYIAPPAPYNLMEQCFIEKLLEMSIPFQTKGDYTGQLSYFKLTSFLYDFCSNDPWTFNPTSENMIEVQKIMGEEWDAKALRREWEYLSGQGCMGCRSASRLCAITTLHHCVIHNIVTWL